MPVLFGSVLFVAAVLLFGAQPMMGKQILPLLGGTPSVWTTCVMFFQFVLLAGYLYAHASARLLSLRAQTILHLVVLTIGIVALPPRVSIEALPAWPPAATVVWLLALTIGPAIFAVSSTAPLLQRWFSLLHVSRAGDPYFLYAASNAGSLIALVSYPFVVEPALGVIAQGRLWGAGYLLLIALTAACAWFVSLQGSPATADARPDSPALPTAGVSAALRARWILLSAVPSSVMLSVTTYITTDIAAVPLFWVLPLALYLLTYVLAFAQRRVLSVKWMQYAFPAVILPALYLIASGARDPRVIIVHLAAMFVVAYVCHAALNDLRPPPSRLTEYYVWIAAGGFIGGTFNTLIAPLVLSRAVEYPLALIAAAALWSNLSRATLKTRQDWIAAVTIPVVVFALAVATPPPLTSILRALWPGLAAGAAVPLLVAVAFAWHPTLLVLSLIAMVCARTLLPISTAEVVHEQRSFFGSLRVLSMPRVRTLEHGTTNHGAQLLNPNPLCQPITYFTPSGPVGRLLGSRQHIPGRVGIAGLGIGALAVYARPGQRFTFFEINPEVERIARDPRFFTFLSDCAQPADVVIGDARLTISRETDASFELLLLDAFSSDAVPVHLLTLEALELYLRKVTDQGIVGFQVTNRHLDLAPILGRAAQELGVVAVLGHDQQISPVDASRGKLPSTWVVMARTAAPLAALMADPFWQPAPVSDEPPWTDDHSNVVGALFILHGAGGSAIRR